MFLLLSPSFLSSFFFCVSLSLSLFFHLISKFKFYETKSKFSLGSQFGFDFILCQFSVRRRCESKERSAEKRKNQMHLSSFSDVISIEWNTGTSTHRHKHTPYIYRLLYFSLFHLTDERNDTELCVPNGIYGLVVAAATTAFPLPLLISLTK